MINNENSNDFITPSKNDAKTDNPNWEFVGKLKDIKVFNEDNKVFSWITTSTTFFVIQGFLTEPVHAGQTVKLSKRDNAARIGSILVYRPEEEEEQEESLLA